MTDIKTNFHTWLTQSKDNQSKTTPLTANEYINRLNRLSKRLYDKEGLQYISDNIYILRLLFMDSSNWVNISFLVFISKISRSYLIKQILNI